MINLGQSTGGGILPPTLDFTLSTVRINTYNEASPACVSLLQALPLLSPEQQDTLGFGSDLQQLYAAVTAHRKARKRQLSEEHIVEQDKSSTQEPELPPSLGGARFFLEFGPEQLAAKSCSS